jgi:hypothetical protein
MPSVRKTSLSSPATSSRRPALTLVPRTPRHRSSHSPLALWHLLSLDAPSVAIAWTFAVAHTAGLHLPWTAAAAIFLAVWILYAADRLLDARLLDARSLAPQTHPADLEERHRFHHRHRRAFLLGIIVSACALATLLRTLDPHALRLYTWLATLLAAYFVLIHARAVSAHRLPKELAVGVFFPAAVFIPTVARLPQLRLDLLPVALLLATLCSLNCLFLYAWEHPNDRAHAHWSTRWATRHLVPLTWTVAVLGILSALFLPPPLRAPDLHHSIAFLTICISASALLLLALHSWRRRVNRIHLRALADLVLLTPLLAAAVRWLAAIASHRG